MKRTSIKSLVSEACKRGNHANCHYSSWCECHHHQIQPEQCAICEKIGWDGAKFDDIRLCSSCYTVYIISQNEGKERLSHDCKLGNCTRCDYDQCQCVHHTFNWPRL